MQVQILPLSAVMDAAPCEADDAGMSTNRTRHQFYLPADLSAQLEALAAKGRTTKSAILTDTLNAWLQRRAAHELDQRFGARLDRHTRMLDRAERSIELLLEMLGVFVQHQMTLVAHQPTFDAETARLGRERYEALLELVARRISKRRKASVLPSTPDDDETQH